MRKKFNIFVLWSRRNISAKLKKKKFEKGNKDIVVANCKSLGSRNKNQISSILATKVAQPVFTQ